MISALALPFQGVFGEHMVTESCLVYDVPTAGVWGQEQ